MILLRTDGNQGKNTSLILYFCEILGVRRRSRNDPDFTVMEKLPIFIVLTSTPDFTRYGEITNFYCFNINPDFTRYGEITNFYCFNINTRFYPLWRNYQFSLF